MNTGDRHTPAGTPRSKRFGTPLLQVRGLSKYFDVGTGLRPKRLRALNGIDLDLYRGEVIALVGESGSGKSTVLRVLSRLEAPTSGTLIFKGKNLLADEPHGASLAYRRQVQMIFQDPFGSLNPVHRVAHHLERPLRRHGRASTKAEALARTKELLETVGLHPAADFASKFPHEMSGGQRQRVAIARALAPDPDLILADEPISMLDVSIRMGILNLMDDLRTKRGLGYLYVTHDIASARYIADRTMVMYAGHIVEGGPSTLVMAEPLHPYTKLLLEAVPDPRGDIFRPLPAKSGQPVLVDPPPGCPFAPRCNDVMPRCNDENPVPLRIRRKGDPEPRIVRCHLYRDEAITDFAEEAFTDEPGSGTGATASAAALRSAEADGT